MGDTENKKDLLDEEAETAEIIENSDDEEDAASEYNDLSAKIADLEEELAAVKEALAEEKEKYVRLYAEYENYRKRTIKEKAEIYQNATSKCIEEILPVVDSFERSLEAECSDENFKNGMQMIFNQLKAFLDKMNVKAIDALGAEFDPNFHNAIQQLDGTDYASNHVCQVFQKGYMIGDKLIRPAMVAVAL